jgi:rhodanese-related sulfurtransferase
MRASPAPWIKGTRPASVAFHDMEHELDAVEVERHIREDRWAVVDVREDDEVAAGHIAGARHLPMAQLTAAAETIDREAPVVFVCRSGSRSGMAADAFRQAGWEAYNLRGGLLAWVEADLPLQPEGGVVALS